jgi:riboflavin synthase
MFTGIVEEVGMLVSIQGSESGMVLEIECAVAVSDASQGDSILTDGCCVTVTELTGRGFRADLQPETVRRTTFARRQPGQRVNLERALTLETRLGGHLVSGDVDGQGTVRRVRREGNAVVVDLEVPADVLRLSAAQGRITVDGVGLTVVGVGAGLVRVSLIPHTVGVTTLDDIPVGRVMNVEADLIARYVYAFVAGHRLEGGLTWEKLAEAGF